MTMIVGGTYPANSLTKPDYSNIFAFFSWILSSQVRKAGTFSFRTRLSSYLLAAEICSHIENSLINFPALLETTVIVKSVIFLVVKQSLPSWL